MIMEPLFTPASPMWSTPASPGFGWQASMPAGARNPVGSGAAPAASPMGAYPVFAPPDLSWPPTASVLVSAVAARRGQPAGPTTDSEIEEFLYDALELLPGTADLEVRCDSGRVTLSGTVSHKRQKHDVGEIAWAIPSLADVQNTVTIASRRRARATARENEAQPGQVRKHA
jgi:hypothetical protein